MANYFGKDQRVINHVRTLPEQGSNEIQPYGKIAELPIALAESICKRAWIILASSSPTRCFPGGNAANDDRGMVFAGGVPLK